ncbi:MAG: hypothetical protein ACREFP_19045 [Acetobacteraceae bacterium]
MAAHPAAAGHAHIRSPLINEVILPPKASSLISVVGVAELTRISMDIASSTCRPLETYLTAGVIYP